jgi:hypothetical protein
MDLTPWEIRRYEEAKDLSIKLVKGLPEEDSLYYLNISTLLSFRYWNFIDRQCFPNGVR